LYDSVECFAANSFTFTNLSSPVNGQAKWSFGDGNTSSSWNNNYSYLSPGTFSVKLIITNSSNCEDSITKRVYVNPSPKHLFQSMIPLSAWQVMFLFLMI